MSNGNSKEVESLRLVVARKRLHAGDTETTGVSAERRGTLQFIGVANLIVCALFLIMSIPFFMGQIRVLRSWPVTTAQVTKSAVVNQPAPKHSQLYAAQLQIAYVVDGKPITVDLTSYQSCNYDATTKRAAEFPVGSTREIRYDPAHQTRHASAQAGTGASSPCR